MNIRTFISFVEMFGPEERPNTVREISTVFPAIETSHISGNPDNRETSVFQVFFAKITVFF